MEFFIWQNYRCAFESVPAQGGAPKSEPALLLIHPIGVGLSKAFWQPFMQRWTAMSESHRAVYNVDLLGCGESDMPAKAYTPQDWAEQLNYFIMEVAREPVVLVVQGALLPVAVRLMALPAAAKVKGLALSGPPAWRLMTTPADQWKQLLSWKFFDSVLGNLFYRYARRERFLRSFSERQLFARAEDVTDGWLKMLDQGSQNLNSRYAVFSFLAGFWRQDYADAIARIQQPVLIVIGENASTIDRTTAKEENTDSVASNEKRLQDYLDHFPRAVGVSIPGRNVLPYESTDEFVSAVDAFIANL
ncbi:MAG: alpha/beta fold hydrolase [Phormidesmis sp.]